MARLGPILRVLLCALPLIFGVNLAQAMQTCQHGTASSDDKTPCPCCPPAAMTGVGCVFACQPALQQAVTFAAPKSTAAAIPFAILDQQRSGRNPQPPEPPPRGDLSFDV